MRTEPLLFRRSLALTIALVVSAPCAAQPTTLVAIEMNWRGADCPTQKQLELALAATSISVLPGAAQRVTVTQSQAGIIELELGAEGRSHRRTLQPQACDALAATMAGVIERFVRPLASQPVTAPATAGEATGATTSTEGSRVRRGNRRDATHRNVAQSDRGKSTSPGGTFVSGAVTVDSAAQPNDDRSASLGDSALAVEQTMSPPPQPLNRLGLGGSLAFSATALARPGIEVRYARWLTSRLDVAGALTWLTSLRAAVATGGLVHTDELRLLLALGLRPLESVPLFFELGGTLRGLLARSTNLTVVKRAVLLSPAVSLGAALRIPISRFTFETAVRSLFFFDQLRLQVDERDVLVLHRFEASVTVAMYVAF